MVFIALAIVAVTEFLKRIGNQDWQGAAIIGVAVIVGTIAGWAKLDGLTVTNGVLAALGACGIHTVATRIG